jgi:hypothetical protein
LRPGRKCLRHTSCRSGPIKKRRSGTKRVASMASSGLGLTGSNFANPSVSPRRELKTVSNKNFDTSSTKMLLILLSALALLTTTAQTSMPKAVTLHETTLNSTVGCISQATAVARAIAGAQGQYEEAVCKTHTASGYGPYRCDCSGLASYAWKYPAPGFVTSGMAGVVCTVLGSWNDLEPGKCCCNNFMHLTQVPCCRRRYLAPVVTC